MPGGGEARPVIASTRIEQLDLVPPYRAPIVLLHAPGESGAEWSRVIAELAATHTVIAPELGGDEGSGAGDGRLGAALVLRRLAAVIEDSGGAAAVLVGHSHGGVVAARFAARRPDLVRALVLVDTLGLAPLRPRTALALIPFLARTGDATGRPLSNGAAVDVRALRAGMRRRIDALAVAHAEELEEIAAPTTLIWGREDLRVPLAVAAAESARHGWPLYVIEGAGDDPATEQPARFLRALRCALPDHEETT